MLQEINYSVSNRLKSLKLFIPLSYGATVRSCDTGVRYQCSVPLILLCDSNSFRYCTYWNFAFSQIDDTELQIRMPAIFNEIELCHISA